MRERVQGTNWPPLPLRAFLDRLQNIVQPGALIHTGQRVQITYIDLLRHFSATVQIG